MQAERWGCEYGVAAERGHLASGWLKGDWDGDMIDNDDLGRWKESLGRGWGWETMALASCSGDEANDSES